MATITLRRSRILEFVQLYQGVIGLLLLYIFAFFANRSYLELGNISNILIQVAVPGVLALGMTFVIMTGGIDLSVGSLLALINCIIATWARDGASFMSATGYGLLVSTLIGTLIGVIISYTGMQAFVVTLAAMVSLRGIAYVYTNNGNVSGMGDFMKPLSGDVLGLPVLAWVFLVMAAMLGLLLSKTVFGRYVYSIGGNEQAARLSGVPVNRTRILAYTINGFCVGLAALLFTSRTNNGQPGAGIGFELDAIAAVVVGGASLMGGYGSMFGTVVGSLFIASMNVLLTYMSIDDKVGLGLKGVIILLAVYVQNLGRRKS